MRKKRKLKECYKPKKYARKQEDTQDSGMFSGVLSLFRACNFPKPFIIDFSFALIRYFCGFIKFTSLPPFICHS